MKSLAAALLLLMAGSAWAEEAKVPYRLQPGDVLEISIWNEDSMRRQVRVLPDGSISYPLAGHMSVSGITPKEAEDVIKKRLVEGQFYVDPPLTVTVVEPRGNEIFILGRVRNPGAFVPNRRIDVMQALALAGGLDDFAAKKDIIVLRRNGDEQEVYRFNYADVHSGRDLSSNIRLEVGDVLVIPETGMF